MTLTIDDGTFIIGNTLVTMEEADSFHESRGNDTWAETDEVDRETALVRSYDFLSIQNWKSSTFETEIPQRIKQAQYIGALKELSESGSTQPDIQTGIKKEEIEDVVSVEYFEGGENSGTIFTAIENLIRPYLISSSSRKRLVRGGGAST